MQEPRNPDQLKTAQTPTVVQWIKVPSERTMERQGKSEKIQDFD